MQRLQVVSNTNANANENANAKCKILDIKSRISLTTHPHQPLRNPQPSMRAHNTQTGNMTMLIPVRRLLLHLREHVSNDLGILA